MASKRSVVHIMLHVAAYFGHVQPWQASWSCPPTVNHSNIVAVVIVLGQLGKSCQDRWMLPSPEESVAYLSSSKGPWQLSPPQKGAGLSQTCSRLRMKALSQALHSVHSVQAPCTFCCCVLHTNSSLLSHDVFSHLHSPSLKGASRHHITQWLKYSPNPR